MKTLVYNGNLGPDTVTFGVAGRFTKGIPVTVEDDAVADQLIAKGCVTEVKPAKAAATKEG